jgi:hypothetical protein
LIDILDLSIIIILDDRFFYFRKEFIMNEYTQQAQKFLEDTNTTFTVVAYRGRSHMPHDTQPMDKWSVCLERNGKEWDFDFYMGTGHNGAEPTAYDVLACIEKYEVGDLEDFCYEFGYDIYSEDTEAIYKAVKAEYSHVVDMFEDFLDELREIV